MNSPLSHVLRLIRKPRRLPRGPRMFVPKRLEERYAEAIKTKIFSKWKEAARRLIVSRLPALELEVENERPHGLRQDSWSDELDRQLDRLSQEYDTIANQSKAIATGTFQEVNAMSHAAWYAAAKRVMGVDLLSFEPWLENEAKAFVSENVELITKTKAQVLSDINRIVMGGFRQGKRWETLSDQILQGTDLQPGVFAKLETRADLIARDQTSKLWGNLNEKRQTNAGIDLYIWRTADDERVRGNPEGKYPDSRPSHWVMEGKYCTWKDATIYADTLEDALAGKWKNRPAIKGPISHPSQEINCRCYGEAVFAQLFAEVK